MTETIPAEVIEKMARAVECVGHSYSLPPESLENIREAIKAAEAIGWVMVPAEPTEMMVVKAGPIIVEAWKGQEWASEQHSLSADMGAVYRAMIAARPKVP